jgi:thiol-disulfide isomerase/thioredoxin
MPVAALLCGLALLVVTVSVPTFASRLGDEPPSLHELRSGSRFPPAPEIDGIAQWLNGEPATLAELRGNVVLVDFWTYTCVNCLRTIPQLQAWNDQYADDGLRIIGIHTPEFEFEKDPDNVLDAVHTLGVAWPIALDNDYATWDNFENVFWPTKYLIDHRGRLRYHRIGEGNYQSFEDEMRALLREAESDLSDDPVTPAIDDLSDARFDEAPDKHITQELYAGYERGDFQREYYGVGFVGQREYYEAPNRTLELEAPEYLEPDLLYFQGVWRNEAQRALRSRETTDFEDYVALVYSAKAVNVVMSAEGNGPIKVGVRLDGEFLTEADRGADVTIGADGESYLMVDESRMYRVVESPEYAQRRELELRVNSAGLAVYAFTFGIYAEGP